MAEPFPDHYATLGLDRRCTASQIQAAYRELAAKFHPDRNRDSESAPQKMRELNEAYEILSDPSRRRIYHRDLDEARRQERGRTTTRNPALLQDAYLPIKAFFRGAELDVRVNDPSNPEGAETYHLEVPAETAPGSRFRIPRAENSPGGIVQVRVKALPNHRFKARGSDLRCDLRIASDRAQKGGAERIPGPDDSMITVKIPPRVTRGNVIRIPGQGLPKTRGGRGDLLVRVMYRPDVRVSRRN